MKRLLLFICFGLMTACDSSDREQKLADEVLELKTTQIQQEAEQKIAKIRDDFTAQLEELNVQHQKENADAASVINNLREENQTLKLQLAASIKDHGVDAEGGAHGEPTAVEDPSKKDDSKGPISIVGEGEAIVVNPANSGGTRYLLVDIYLTRDDEKDKGFKSVIDTNSKKLQSVTMDKLSEYDINQLSSLFVRKQIVNDLKKQYQTILGFKHPIKELVVTRWIIQ